MEDIKRIIEELNYRYSYDEERKLYRVGFNLPCKLKECRVLIKEINDILVIYGTINISADKETMGNAAEFLTRANYGLLMGNFEMDYSDGEIRYKITYDISLGEALNKELLDRFIGITVAMFERYGNGLLEVLFNFSTPEESIKKIENVSKESIKEIENVSEE